jgi:hypothetical protein
MDHEAETHVPINKAAMELLDMTIVEGNAI